SPIVTYATHNEVDWRSALRDVFFRHAIADDDVALANAGLDSLALTEIQAELEDALRRFGFGALAESLDAPLLQRLSMRDLLSALASLDHGLADRPRLAIAALAKFRTSIEHAVHVKMRADSELSMRARIN